MKRFKLSNGLSATIAAGPVLLASTSTALAQAATPKLDSGDTAWMLISTALVLMMTIPGLALFYGGMVRRKNVLSVLMQCFAITCLMSILWMVIGYSLAFAEGNAYVGGTTSSTDSSGFGVGGLLDPAVIRDRIEHALNDEGKHR